MTDHDPEAGDVSETEQIVDRSSAYAEIPAEEIEEPENALPAIELKDLPESAQKSVIEAGWNRLTPVQSRAIPYILEGRDLMVQSRTGSGKTGAFLLPIMVRVDPRRNYCQALVLTPTRELALQVSREAENFGRERGIRTVAVYGGVGYTAQYESFKAGAHVVIGTPGRILDHLMRGSLDLDDLEILIFDEADRMMSMGFYPDMIAIRRYVPKRRSSFMFSATFPVNVKGLAREFLNEPVFLSLSHGNVSVSSMDHAYYEVPAMDKDRALIRIIEVENPVSAIIFCNTKQRVNYVTTVLQRFGYDADQLTADLTQKKREEVLDRIRAGNLRFLVATDVAARGIDISNLSHVFLFEFPEDQESYIHRAGRTGRAGAGGVCLSLVTYMEVPELERVVKRYGIDMEKREVPSDEDVADIVGERITALLEQKLRDRDRLETERMRRFWSLARRLAENEDELDVLAMLLDDFYHQTMHAPPVLPGFTSSTQNEPGQGESRQGDKKDGGKRRRSSGPGRRGRSRR